MPADNHQPETATVAALAGALTFHAGFDSGADAELGAGDRRLYTATLGERRRIVGLEPGLGNPPLAIVPGKFGGALEFRRENTHLVVYKADGNVAYSQDGEFQGTVSLWLNLDPSAIERPTSDPFQLTDKGATDSCVWVDFTKTDEPPDLRLGLFGERAAWDLDSLGSDGPAFYHRLFKVAEPPFASGQWTHLAVTWDGVNTPRHGRARLYLNGEYQGATGRVHEPFTWDIANTMIRLGVGDFVGLIDDFALFDRSLSAEEVRALHGLAGGISDLRA